MKVCRGWSVGITPPSSHSFHRRHVMSGRTRHRWTRHGIVPAIALVRLSHNIASVRDLWEHPQDKIDCLAGVRAKSGDVHWAWESQHARVDRHRWVLTVCFPWILHKRGTHWLSIKKLGECKHIDTHFEEKQIPKHFLSIAQLINGVRLMLVHSTYWTGPCWKDTWYPKC